jgi:hypothetical protein
MLNPRRQPAKAAAVIDARLIAITPAPLDVDHFSSAAWRTPRLSRHAIGTFSYGVAKPVLCGAQGIAMHAGGLYVRDIRWAIHRTKSRAAIARRETASSMQVFLDSTACLRMQTSLHGVSEREVSPWRTNR